MSLSDYTCSLINHLHPRDLNLEEKSLTYTQNGTYDILPSGDYNGLSNVDLTINVPQNLTLEPNKTLELEYGIMEPGLAPPPSYIVPDEGYDGIQQVTVYQNPIYGEDNHTFSVSSNGTYEIVPIAGCSCMRKATVTVDVDTHQLDLQSKTININHNNSTVSIYPSSGYVGLKEVTCYVNISSSPRVQRKSISFTPTRTTQNVTVSPDDGYAGLSACEITVGPAQLIPGSCRANGVYTPSSPYIGFSSFIVNVPSYEKPTLTSFHFIDSNNRTVLYRFSDITWVRNNTGGEHNVPLARGETLYTFVESGNFIKFNVLVIMIILH
jgi:hypothetical protein